MEFFLVWGIWGGVELRTPCTLDMISTTELHASPKNQSLVPT